MRTRTVIHTVDSHTGGEPTRLIVSGIPIRGSSLLEQRDYVRKNHDTLRAALMREPRGHRGMFGAIVAPSTRPEVDFGIIWVDHDGSYLNMCGHGTIGIGVTSVECGLVPVSEPKTHIRIDMPAGLVEVDVAVEGGCATSASFVNVPAFLYKRDLSIDVPGLGKAPVDIAFGGSFFAAVHGPDVGLDVRAENAPALVKAGLAIKAAVNKSVKVAHPTLSHIRSVDLVTIYGPPLAAGAKYKNIHVFSDGSFDRSPGGTGTSHMMALLIGKGRMEPDEKILAEGISGSLFTGRMIKRAKIGDVDGFIPEVGGTAFVTGFHQFVIDPADPIPEGLAIG